MAAAESDDQGPALCKKIFDIRHCLKSENMCMKKLYTVNVMKLQCFSTYKWKLNKSKFYYICFDTCRWPAWRSRQNSVRRRRSRRRWSMSRRGSHSTSSLSRSRMHSKLPRKSATTSARNSKERLDLCRPN